MRTIKVTGKGQISVKPDTTRITLSLGGVAAEYSETVRLSSEETESLKELLSKFGFERSDLKTLNFSVEPEHESYKENGVYKNRLIGYRFSHRLRFQFESDNVRLGRILYALANSPLSPEFDISYTVKDPEAAKNELLGKAVRDAFEKATVLTGAAGVKLKEIQNIDYSWGEISFDVHPMNKMMLEDGCACPTDQYDIDIEPDDIKVSDTVTVVWEIE